MPRLPGRGGEVVENQSEVVLGGGPWQGVGARRGRHDGAAAATARGKAGGGAVSIRLVRERAAG